MKADESYTHIKGLTQLEKEKFRQLIKNSFDIIVLLDENGKQIYVSDSCEPILGFRPDELINIPVIDLMIHPDDKPDVLTGLKGIIQDGEHGGTQYRHRHKDGGWVYLEAFGSNQLDNPMISAVVLNVRDITKRKESEQAHIESERRLAEMNAAKDRFFSIIGHDLKTPFNGIMGLSELLTDQLAEGDYEGAEEYARMIHHSSKMAYNLLSNLLEWSKAQTGKIKYKPQLTDLNYLIKDSIDLLRNAAQRKQITIQLNLPENLQVYADPHMVQAVLRNLISNGIKFTPAEGDIMISATEFREENKVWVSVKDSGIGIPEEIRTKLFRIDFNHTTKGTNHETGSGLGLLICKEFTDLQGGEIRVEAVTGGGSNFIFSLPCASGISTRKHAPESLK